MEEFGSFKDFESVILKATYNIEIGDRKIEPGETIAFFDKVQISGLNEVSDYITAHGGYEDRTRVIWDRTKELHLTFSRGVFSKEQLALMYNSQLIDMGENEFVMVPMSSQGRNLPHLVFVFATITPMMGSLNASKTRAAIIMAPITVPFIPKRS